MKQFSHYDLSKFSLNFTNYATKVLLRRNFIACTGNISYVSTLISLLTSCQKPTCILTL